MKSKVLVVVALLLTGWPASRASERAEYEGEFRFNLRRADGDSPLLIHVATLDGHVQRITLRDGRAHSDRLEAFDYAGTTLIRYQIIAAVSEKIIANYDLSSDTTLSQPERERVLGVAILLLRHFYQKGHYRPVKSKSLSCTFDIE